ncbi:hypothetical protein CERSUDRAFT_92074 [Gelatoporia subvermispora B]|uniref:Uncharacterized protein n=1 Tax=Ceriporiopsis subvermispora (strain B) TaxID=914234 RepID=M2RL79_CERS8|nr:hypothetical protein CERSUDRAFT_92074 [Gelatoporia subvermispora B]
MTSTSLRIRDMLRKKLHPPVTSADGTAPSEVDKLYAVLPDLPQDEVDLVATLSMEELRDWAFQKMKEQSEYALSYRSLYNSTSLINRLPTELLTKIVFLWIFADFDWLERPSYGWMARMGVCRSWRAIALSTSLLWTKITSSLARAPPPLRTFLQRSCTCKISLHLRGDFVSPERKRSNSDLDVHAILAEVVARCPERVQAVYIELFYFTDTPVFNDILLTVSRECTNITTLELVSPRSSSPVRIDFSALPNLRRLLCSAQIRINALAPTRLTSLAWNCSNSLPSLLSLLQCSPELETLRLLSNDGGDATQTKDPHALAQRASPRISLPSLRKLDLCGSNHARMVHILSHFHDLQAFISIEDPCEDDEDASDNDEDANESEEDADEDEDLLPSPFLQTIPALVDACARALILYQEPAAMSIIMEGKTTRFHIIGGPRRWSVSFNLRRNGQEDGNISAIIPVLALEFGLPHFVALHIIQSQATYWLKPFDWRTTLTAVRVVYEIRVISDEPIDDLWEALGQQDGTTGVAVPDLQRIQCQLDHRRGLALNLEHTVRLMVKCLAYRKQCGVEVQLLEYEAFVESLSQQEKETHKSVKERLAPLAGITSFNVRELQ